jgi:hypothetical protein
MTQCAVWKSAYKFPLCCNRDTPIGLHKTWCIGYIITSSRKAGSHSLGCQAQGVASLARLFAASPRRRKARLRFLIKPWEQMH